VGIVGVGALVSFCMSAVVVIASVKELRSSWYNESALGIASVICVSAC
jgi:hypothetical protein